MNKNLIKECGRQLESLSGVTSIETDTLQTISKLIVPRKDEAHKGCFGHALLIAGSRGMAGASLLCAKGCMRSGVGLLTIHAPIVNNVILQLGIPEAMVDIDSNEDCFSSAINAERYSAVGLGPGLGHSEITTKALYHQLSITNKPMVLDADAINILSENLEWIDFCRDHTVITPHPGELKRLSGGWNDVHEMYFKAAEIAKKYSIVVVVKGAPTATVTPDGRWFVNTTGNSGMATGGSGDVLTGIVLALLAQGYEPIAAARIAVSAHGLAGDIAAKKRGEIAMTSETIANFLPEAWLKLSHK